MTRIEDYAIIGDCKTAALICKDGSMDWLCLPYFDSAACFAALIGSAENGQWVISPSDKIKSSKRSYKEDTLILDTIFETETGKVLLTDFMTINSDHSTIFRSIKGLDGKVKMKMEINPRFEYGDLIPLFLPRDDGVHIIKGPDLLYLRPEGAEVEVDDYKIISAFEIEKGKEVSFQLSYASSHEDPPEILDVNNSLEDTKTYWEDWLESCHLDDDSPHPGIIKRAVLVLKALTCTHSGSIVAAVTTSLPEELEGCRNWDYRFCWPRDASLAMRAVLNSTGQQEEIKAWRHWILRATAGIPAQMEVLYTLEGTQSIKELEIPWLSGYENSKPVRIGNKAHEQMQHDIFAYVIDVFYLADKMGFPPLEESWDLARSILIHLESMWKEADEGIWEVRGPRRHFVHSKAMVWSAFDICIRAHEQLGVKGPVEKWKEIRNIIHEDICRNGFNTEVNSFTQFYGSDRVDANLLHLPIIGFLPVDDPRIQSTIKKIEKDLLLEEGLMMRYIPDPDVEGLPETGRRAFLLCSAWLGEVYILQGRIKEAEAVFYKLTSLANDVGLLSEQYDINSGRQLGNFPQAFSHIALLRLEIALCKGRKG